MLILTRKRSEMIRIGDRILVKVIRTGRNTVKIGIEAPANVRVLRGELCVEAEPARKGDAFDLDEAEDDSESCDLWAGLSDQFPHPALA